MSSTVFTPALEAIPAVKDASGEMLTKPFLDLCSFVLPVIDKFGSALALVKSDIGGNIKRLNENYEKDPVAFELLYSVVKKEVAAGTAKGSGSCSNGLLWLTRAMDFLVALFRLLRENQDWTMSQVAGEAYALTLKKYHGWIAQSAFTMALKLIPNRETFMAKLGGGDIDGDIDKFVAAFSPLLLENHELLKSEGLDNLKAS
eukprot:TRINITY_DN12244_c0_g1_i1.p1 TRINITY_DN12244_c0_g1~~TRINITY_DN12244_c0_g1_i1.p1  ORF type:complete len:214 (+),score=55.54 TRINITY_DN12244_c0_g1_i1:39-644(+)